MRVLVIGDMPKLCEHPSLQCTRARDGREGLAWLAETKFDCAIVDYDLPGMAGLEVLQHIRARRAFMPVIMMADGADVPAAVAALHAGASDCLVKSTLDAATLERAIAAGVAKSGIAAEAAELTKALRASEERCRLLLQSDATEALYLLDPDGNIETWNASAARISGYAAAEIVGRNFSVFFTPELNAIGGPARELARARATGHFADEAWRVRKDGSRFLARVALDAIRRDDGTLRGFVKAMRDITDRQIEEEQRAIMLEAAPNGMLIVDEGGIISLANSQVERIFGYPAALLVGLRADILVPEGFLATRDAPAPGAGGAAMPPARHVKGRRRNGSMVLLELTLNPVTTPRGSIIVASLFDITEKERKAAERQQADLRERAVMEGINEDLDRLSRHLVVARDRAEQASQAKSRFLAGITHELRTPLHGILGHAELLTLEGDLNLMQAQRLEIMMVSGQHLLDMINAVLDMSQIEADQLELQPVEIELSAIIRTCLDVVGPAATTKGLALNLAPSVPIQMVADPTRLRQVVLNLMGNAIKFTPSGTVEVRQSKTETCVRVEVADTGPGVRAQHRDKLFQTFERLNAEAVSGIEGAGLGLAIAARLVQLMQGRIGYADNPGGGSVFWFELPMREAVAPAQIKQQAPVSLVAAPRMRVLVADDEALNRSIAREFLSLAGHEVVCVEDGAEAVVAASAEDFDVILMDVRMPGMNGLEATRLIRRLLPPRGDVRIVAVTAQAFAKQIEMCRAAGMDSHLSKPFKQAVLLACLQGTGAAPTRPAPEPVLTDAEPELPMFDRATFEDNTDCMAGPARRGHLEVLVTRCEALLRGLREPGMPALAGALAEDAHRLAGGAGTFGFLYVAAAARAFEAAVDSNAPETVRFAGHLAAAITKSLDVIRNEIAAAP